MNCRRGGETEFESRIAIFLGVRADGSRRRRIDAVETEQDRPGSGKGWGNRDRRGAQKNKRPNLSRGGPLVRRSDIDSSELEWTTCEINRRSSWARKPGRSKSACSSGCDGSGGDGGSKAWGSRSALRSRSACSSGGAGGSGDDDGSSWAGSTKERHSTRARRRRSVRRQERRRTVQRQGRRKKVQRQRRNHNHH